MAVATELSASFGLGQWVRQQVDAAVETATRDVKEVANAQARLLCVVERVSEELSVLGAQVAKSQSAQTDLVTTRLEAAELQRQFTELSNSHAHNHAELRNQFTALTSDHAHRHNSIAAEFAEDRRLRNEERARHESTFAELRNHLHGGSAGDGFFTRVARLETTIAAHGADAKRSQDAFAELRQLGVAVTRHDASLSEIQRLQQTAERHEQQMTCLRASCQKIEGAGDLRQLAAAVTRHDASLNEVQRLLQTAERHEQHITGLRASCQKLEGTGTCAISSAHASEEVFRKVHETLGQHELAISHLQRQDQARGVPSPRTTVVEAPVWRLPEAPLADGWRVELKEEVNRQVMDIRGAMQSHAAAIKALDEQVWLLDEQLWQVDKRLERRIDDEMARHRMPAVEPVADIGNGVAKVFNATAGLPTEVSFGDVLARTVPCPMGSAQRAAPATSPPCTAVICRDLGESFTQAEVNRCSDQRLQVTIIKATGLKHLNLLGDAPWCLCKVLRGDTLAQPSCCKTAAVKGTLEPVWDETHEILWKVGEAIEFTVYDKGLIGSKTEGKVVVPSDKFFPDGFEGSLSISGLPHALLYVRLKSLTDDVWSSPLSALTVSASATTVTPPGAFSSSPTRRALNSPADGLNSQPCRATTFVSALNGSVRELSPSRGRNTVQYAEPIAAVAMSTSACTGSPFGSAVFNVA
jgi:hypothetical protein